MKLLLWPSALFATSTLLLLPFPIPAIGQASVVSADPNVYINTQQSVSFSTALSALSHVAHVAVVTEGQPLRAEILTKDAPSIRPGSEPLSIVVDKIATAYDYDAHRQGDVFLFRKRYTDPADLPDVTLAECAQALADIQQIGGALGPRVDFADYAKNRPLHDLLSSLTPAQLKAAENRSLQERQDAPAARTEADTADALKKQYAAAVAWQGLPISSLTPEQRDAVRQIVMAVRVQLPTERVDAQQIRQAAEKDPRFRWHDGVGQPRAFGYEVSIGAYGSKVYRQLTFPSQVTRGIDGGITFGPGGRGIPVRMSDPTDPFTASAVRPTSVSQSVSLQHVVTKLNAGDGSGPKISVDAALAPKRVSVFGGEYVAPRALLQAVADVYGLRILRHEDGSRQLTRRPLQIPLDYAAFVEDVQNSLPDPLRRALAQDTSRNGVQTSSSPNAYWGAGVGAARLPFPTLCMSAMRVLRAAAEPRMRTAKDGAVLLSSLPDEENTALAVALTVPQVERLAKLVAMGVPEIVTRFDELRVLGHSYTEGGRKMYAMTLVLPVENGTAPPHEVLGIGSIPFGFGD